MGFDSWCWQRMLWNSILRLDGNWVSQRTHYVWCPTKLQRQTWSRVCLGNFTCAGTWTREGSRWSSAKQQRWKQLALADTWILMNSMQPPQQKRHTTLLFFDIQGVHERIQLNPRHSLHICGGSWGCASTKPIMFTVFFLVGRSGTFKGVRIPKYINGDRIMNDVRIRYRFISCWYLDGIWWIWNLRCIFWTLNTGSSKPFSFLGVVWLISCINATSRS